MYFSMDKYIGTGVLETVGAMWTSWRQLRTLDGGDSARINADDTIQWMSCVNLSGQHLSVSEFVIGGKCRYPFVSTTYSLWGRLIRARLP